ncbi:hypothetical protein BS47DRAFT_1344003 [Hydnum rufescens UP504]|uniref:Uncharacterized protein n=1 Tax=Hydnum rufescens UP504 TaxID=1448309 RepID=A0A9P6AXC0_9AGAM|nr:hypothetical protein BS47DRAFT_1344003 [Hydnum rufescens UP504]
MTFRDLYQAVLGEYSTTQNQSFTTTKKKSRAPQNLPRRAIFQVSDASQCRGLRSAPVTGPCFFVVALESKRPDTNNDGLRRLGSRSIALHSSISAMNVQET